MASGKEIRTKISSIKNTQKITKAMEMVSASKMRKAQDAMQLGKPYAHRIRSVIGHVANAKPEYKHAYFDTREVKRVGYPVIVLRRLQKFFQLSDTPFGLHIARREHRDQRSRPN